MVKTGDNRRNVQQYGAVGSARVISHIFRHLMFLRSLVRIKLLLYSFHSFCMPQATNSNIPAENSGSRESDNRKGVINARSNSLLMKVSDNRWNLQQRGAVGGA
jgi:hypothetical protein